MRCFPSGLSSVLKSERLVASRDGFSEIDVEVMIRGDSFNDEFGMLDVSYAIFDYAPARLGFS